MALLAGAPPTLTGQAFAERLGHWLSWSDAISLSAALNAGYSEPCLERSRGSGGEEADFERVRRALAGSIAAGTYERVSSPTDFGPHHRRCIAMQQAMHDAAGALRQRLRDALSRQSPVLARLAGIDAVMDQALAVRERSLLGLVPLRLKAHFEQLQRTRGDSTDWRETFHDDMNLVLRAELAHRLLPAQGLLDTLRTHRQPT